MLKKIISLFLITALLMVSLGCSFIVFAANSESVESFVESVEELNSEEAEEEKTLEESAGSRVIVKALQKPSVFGNAEYIKGTYGKHIFQYATEEEATQAVEHYRTLSGVAYAVKDNVVESEEVPYGEAMLGTQRAKEYIANNDIPTNTVKVAVIDTGIEFTHEIFKDNPRIVDSGINVTDSGKIGSAWDDKGHGSLCSEIVMDNTGENVSVIGYKVLNEYGSGTNLWVATGIEAAIEDGVDIINLSLGGEAEPDDETDSVVLDDAVRLAISKGIIVVAASGNDGMNAKYFSPANVEGVITVGAIDNAGNHAYFSNYGDCVDFVAPGVQVEHDYIKTVHKYDQYGFIISTTKYYEEPIDGTSFSSPYIAAEISTMLSVFQGLSRDKVVSKLTTVSVPYEHLTYHDGFHPIYEDQGVRLNSKSLISKVDIEIDKSSFFGKGMPQIDLMFDDVVREESPAFSVDSGHYIDEEFDLVLASSQNAEIYYTQDETYPTKENGIKYTGAIHLDELQSVRAVVFAKNKAPSFFAAREYRMEYHAPESDFEFKETQYQDSIRYKNVITNYLGNRRNIIYPDTINGKEVKKVDLVSEHTTLTSAKVPDTCLNVWRKPKTVKNLVSLTGESIIDLAAGGTVYCSLVELNTPGILNIDVIGTPIRKLNLPKAISINVDNCVCLKEVYASSMEKINGIFDNWYVAGKFENCYSLSAIYAPNLKYIGEKGFSHCYKLQNFETLQLEYIGMNAFACNYCMSQLYCPTLKTISGINPFSGSNIQYLYAPNLETCSYPIGFYNYPKFISTLVVSSKFVKCEREAEGYDYDPFKGETFFYHHDLDVYGTPNTYAEEYANQFHLKFVALPLLESEPENMGHQSDSEITAEVLGFNREYQWYGTTLKDNRLGVALEGETGESLDTSQYDYPYYYCVVKTHDGEYKKDIVTGTRKILDMNGDGIIDIADISLLLSRYGSTPEKDFYDVSENGIVDIQDITYLLYSAVYGTKE